MDYRHSSHGLLTFHEHWWWLLLFAVAAVAPAIAQPPERVLLQEPLSRVPAVPTTQVKIGDDVRAMVLDTGTEGIVLDPSFEKLTVSSFESATAIAADGSLLSRQYRYGPPLVAQSLSVPRPLVLLVDMYRVSRVDGRKLGGVLGMSALSGGIISLNYDTALFEVHSGPWRLNGPDSHELALQQDMQTPTFTTEIDGHPVSLLIDSGNDMTISLPSAVFAACVAQGVIDQGTVKMRPETAAGLASLSRGWFTKGTLMGKNLAGMAVNETGTAFGQLGLSWLSGFNIEIDFPAHQFRYQQRKDAKSPIATQLMVGAILWYGGTGARIARLRPGGGPAESAGLKPDDIIETFDGLTPAQMNAATIGEVVAAKAGQSIPIRYYRQSDGTTLETQLQLPEAIYSWNFAGRDILKSK